MKNDEQVEQKIQELGLTAPRVTPARINGLLSQLHLKAHHYPETTTTVATAFLPNGFSLATEISACASPENFNLELGLNIAMDKATASAKENLWAFEGYHLKLLLEKREALQDWVERNSDWLSAAEIEALEQLLLGDYL